MNKVLFFAFVFISVKAGAAASEFATDEKQGRAMCEIFLTPGYREFSILPIPLGNGRWLESLDRNLLFSRVDAENYLREHPKYRYRDELRADLHTMTGTRVIYLAEIGPTLWRTAELAYWTQLASGPLVKDPARAQAALEKLGASEPVATLSPQARERVRNSMLARLEQLRVEHEMRIQSMLYFAPDHEAAGRALFGGGYGAEDKQRQDFFERMVGIAQPAPPPAEALLGAQFQLAAARAGAQAAREIRDLASSLHIPWSTDFSKDRVLRKGSGNAEDLQTVRESEDVIWILRTLVREELFRRRLVNGRSLAEQVSADHLFLLAAHPELFPVWRQAARWRIPIQHVLLHAFDPLETPRLIDMRQTKPYIFHLSIEREFKGAGQTEFLSVSFSITNTDALPTGQESLRASDLEAFSEWLNTEWEEFTRVHGGIGGNPPELELSEEDHQARSEVYEQRTGHSLIQFYAYLFEKFPTLLNAKIDP